MYDRLVWLIKPFRRYETGQYYFENSAGCLLENIPVQTFESTAYDSSIYIPLYFTVDTAAQKYTQLNDEEQIQNTIQYKCQWTKQKSWLNGLDMG